MKCTRTWEAFKTEVVETWYIEYSLFVCRELARSNTRSQAMEKCAKETKTLMDWN
jgi:hypothetical protein